MRKNRILRSALTLVLAGSLCAPLAVSPISADKGQPVTSPAPTKAEEKDINAGSILESYFNSDAGAWSIDKATDSVKDGILYINSSSSTARAVTHKVTEADAFELEIRMKVAKTGKEQGFKFEMDGKRIMAYINADGASVRGKDTSYSFKGFKAGEFNTYKFVVSGNQASVYVNGEYSHKYILPEWNSPNGISVFVCSDGGNHSKVEVDYIKYAHADSTIAISSPIAGSIFVEGAKTTIKSMVDTSRNIPYVDYYANGTFIGSATKEEDYALEWKNLRVGEYTISAKYGEFAAVDSAISVSPKTGTIIAVADKAEMAVGETVSFSLKRKPANIAAVSYFVNGIEYPADADGVLAYSSNILGKIIASAKVSYTDGSYEFSEPAVVYTTASTTDYVVLQESYAADYTAAEGAKITASDGTALLDVTHSASGITYLTADGAKTYNTGLGDYRLYVDGGVCEVYYNGQFAFSFILPITANPNGITASGVSGLKLSGVNSTLARYTGWGIPMMLPNIGSDYALEFTLDNPADFAIEFNNGAYALDLTSFGGNLVAVTDPNGFYGDTDNAEYSSRVIETGNGSEDDKAVTLCTLPAGRHAYRITVSNGISQLFIDNKWEASFRLPQVFAAPYISASGIAPVTVRETEDNYIFRDSLDNAGELSSDSYYNVDEALISTFANGSLTLAPNPDKKVEITAGHTAEFNEEDPRWAGFDFVSFADGAMKLSTTATSAKTASTPVEHAKNYEIEARMRVTSYGAETGFKFEYKTNRILCYLKNGSASITAEGSDKITAQVNTNEWHVYKFVVTDSENCELFIDGVSKAKGRLQARAFNNASISAFVKSSNGTTPATMEIDYIHFTSNDPVEEPQIRITDPVLLKAFAYTPTVSATVRVDSATEGNIYLAARYNNDYRNLLAGYNFDLGTWEIVETATKAKVIASSKSDFPFGKDTELKLIVEENNATLYVNGEREVSTNQLNLPHYGNVGICVGAVTAVVSDFSYEGTGRPLADTFTFKNKVTSPEVFELEDGHIYIIQSDTNAVESKDDGFTWEAVKPGKYSNCTIKLSDGTIVYSKRENEGNGNFLDYAYVSTDNGETFEGPFPIQNYLRNRITMNNKFTEASDGRLFFASGESGDGVEGEGGIRVFYSDDKGRTWTGSNILDFNGKIISGNDEARMDFANTGINCQESKVVEMPDGTLRLYLRTDNGFLYYSVSTDRGETWSARMYPSEFISVLSAFNIERDRHTGDYYMAWEYNNKNDTGKFQHPRTRTGLAVSYDGMETWQYVGDMHETFASNASTHMNIGIMPTKNAVFVNTVYSNEPLEDGTVTTVSYNVRVDKESIKVTDRFTKVHTLNPTVPSSDIAIDINTMLLVNSAYSEIYTRGKLYTVASPVIGYIPASAAAAFIGADCQTASGTVTLKIGETEAVLTEGSANATLNGEAKAISAAPIASADGMFIPLDALTQLFDRDIYTADNGSLISVYDPDGVTNKEAISAYLPLGSLDYISAGYDVPSAWAQPEVFEADYVNLIPHALKSAYRNSITREEFCTLIMQMINKVKGASDSKALLEKLGKTYADNFNDTDNEDVVTANIIGIVNGRGEGAFDPNSGINRQEAAVMLANAAKFLEIKTADGEHPVVEFTDIGNAASWAADSIKTTTSIVSAAGKNVMGGVGNGMFDPLGSYTREQSILTVYRLFMS